MTVHKSNRSDMKSSGQVHGKAVKALAKLLTNSLKKILSAFDLTD